MHSVQWQPSCTLQTLKLRAQYMMRIRNFFNQRGYLEVETPVMAKFGVTDRHLANIKATFRKDSYCLQTSPEYHMKRLLAAGSGPIFQLARVFRDDELGRWHNPEFTMLEWYQLNVDHHLLMDEMDIFLQTILNCPPLKRKTYQQVFLEICEFDPFDVSIKTLQETLVRFGLGEVLASDETCIDQYLFLLMSHIIEPHLAEEQSPVAIYHFPRSQAALAKVNQHVAERFEIYFRGVELANGFHELTDVTAQKERFAKDNALRRHDKIEEAPVDEYLLQALEHGLPPCSGVALGIERLLTLAFGYTSIAEIMSFDFSRA